MQEHSKIDETVDHVKEYINTNYELIVLKASDKIAKTASDLIAKALIAFIAVLSLLILSFAAAYYLSESMGDQYTGFIIMGGVYVVIGLFLFIFRKQMIVTPFRNKMIRDFFND